MKNPWADPGFAELDDRLRVAYLYLRTNPWPLPGVFVLPKKLPARFISNDELSRLILTGMVESDQGVVYVPGCVPGMPSSKVKVNSLLSRLEKIPESKPKQGWVNELRGIYEESRPKADDVHCHLGQKLFGEDVLSSKQANMLGADEIKKAAIALVAYFKEQHELVHNKPYIVSVHKDSRLMEELLRQIGEDEIQGRIRTFLNHRWYVENEILRISVFHRNINQFKPSNSTDQDLSEYKRFIDRIN